MQCMIAFCVFSLLPQHAYRPPTDYRCVDETGRRYVSVRQLGGSSLLSIAERRPGAGRIAPLRKSTIWNGDRYVRVNLDAGSILPDDTLLGQVTIARSPDYMYVSSMKLGVIGIYYYGSIEKIRSDDEKMKMALIHINDKGKLIFSKDLFDIFGERSRRFPVDRDIFEWFNGCWIDEDRREFVIVSTLSRGEPTDRIIKLVSLDTGVIRDGGPDEIVRKIASGNRGEMQVALETAGDMRLRPSTASISKILDDAAYSTEVRLRAAVLLAKLGDRRGSDFVVKAAQGKSSSGPASIEEVSLYAIDNLQAVSGDEAFKIWIDIMSKYKNDIESRIVGAFRRAGKPAISFLVSRVEDGREVETQLTAMKILSRLGPAARVAIPSLEKLAVSPETVLREGALDALGAITAGNN